MKASALITLLLLFTSFANAASDYDLADYVWVQAGFGTGGATLESYPREDSVQNAIEIYDALTVAADPATEKKAVRVEGVSDSELGFVCKAPRDGVHTTTAGCDFTGITAERLEGFVIDIGGDVAFSGTQARGIFQAIDQKFETVRGGATTREVANLSCVRTINPRLGDGAFSCTISGSAVTKAPLSLLAEGMSTDNPNAEKELKQAVKELGY